ncbi:hypothetical protein [Pseudonocardia endophytica]|uniref:Uncharacterized protein n=1 Tax=Pseudonocardia endophytica TaxID=401976 RepID=A0A4V2PIF4_PSEEN|nr:hypothetical protein [Pseudonocardia endophytica]TCK24416.1 hypothetical protein EV378_0188 [Pseudonocardia endophytica]
MSSHLVPDLDGDLLWALVRVEELLLTLAAAENDPRRPLRLPPVVSGGRALEALGRVHAALLPTQNGESVTATPADAPRATRRRWVGADGRRLRPLGLAEVEPADLTVLSRTATSLGYELALRPDGGLARALVAAAQDAADPPGGPPSAVELVESLARVLGLLDLVDTDDTVLLVRRMRSADDDTLELTAEEEDAHRRTLERMTGMWGSIPA